MRISVVIPTYNRLARLRSVLAALAAQRFDPAAFEVVVVSDGSTDGTDAHLRGASYPFALAPLAQPNAGPAAARNTGVAQARGALILFIDDDVVPHPELLAEHDRAHAAAGPGSVVIGPLATPGGFAMQPWVRWEQDRLAEQYAAMCAGRWAPTARQFYTGNASLAREHVLAAGGFTTTLRRAEDIELGYRLAAMGLTFVFNPAAIGLHYAERSFRSWLTTPYVYGRNDVVFALDHGQGWIVARLKDEFADRHPLVRWLVRACLGRPALHAAAIGGLRALAQAAQAARRRRLASAAYSALFNLRYYQGVADELCVRGGRLQLAGAAHESDEWPQQTAPEARPR